MRHSMFCLACRRISAPLPHFIETFMDNGYYDMYKIMKALRNTTWKVSVEKQKQHKGTKDQRVKAAQGR